VLDAATAARRIARVGEIVENQMRFWNEFYAIILETYEDVNGDGQRFMPRNGRPAQPFDRNRRRTDHELVFGRRLRAQADDALIVEVRVPVAPAYGGSPCRSLEVARYATTRAASAPQTKSIATAPLAVVISGRRCELARRPACRKASWRCAGRTRKSESLPSVSVTKFASTRSKRLRRNRRVTAGERVVRIRQRTCSAAAGSTEASWRGATASAFVTGAAGSARRSRNGSLRQARP
jgi:hypothetical protein